MRIPANPRTRTTGWGRLLLGLFVVGWLNLAIQPCLMAMETVPDPAAGAAHAAHAAHAEHASHSPDRDCDHCPPALAHHADRCASALAALCDPVPDLSNDGRNGVAKVKDLPTYVAVADLSTPFEPTAHGAAPPTLVRTAAGFPGEPPLNIRFCVFLK